MSEYGRRAEGPRPCAGQSADDPGPGADGHFSDGQRSWSRTGTATVFYVFQGGRRPQGTEELQELARRHERPCWSARGGGRPMRHSRSHGRPAAIETGIIKPTYRWGEGPLSESASGADGKNNGPAIRRPQCCSQKPGRIAAGLDRRAARRETFTSATPALRLFTGHPGLLTVAGVHPGWDDFVP